MKKLFTLLTMLLLMSVTAKAQIVEKPAGEEKLYVRIGGETRSNIVWTKLKDYATGLSSVLSDTSASRRFFMLNGVETKSPSGKIVVVKSGTKVRKMVVR